MDQEVVECTLRSVSAKHDFVVDPPYRSAGHIVYVVHCMLNVNSLARPLVCLPTSTFLDKLGWKGEELNSVELKC
jgi:hypothetical protein